MANRILYASDNQSLKRALHHQYDDIQYSWHKKWGQYVDLKLVELTTLDELVLLTINELSINSTKELNNRIFHFLKIHNYFL